MLNITASAFLRPLHEREATVYSVGNSYTPEGTFLPRKEGSFRGRKIFVREEAFK